MQGQDEKSAGADACNASPPPRDLVKATGGKGKVDNQCGKIKECRKNIENVRWDMKEPLVREFKKQMEKGKKKYQEGKKMRSKNKVKAKGLFSLIE